MTPDIINGLFEFTGGLFIATSVVKLHREKRVAGVHWVHPTFFTAWGFWNLFYYPSLDQWYSFAGGLFIVVMNAIWVGQLIYYGADRAAWAKSWQDTLASAGSEWEDYWPVMKDAVVPKKNKRPPRIDFGDCDPLGKIVDELRQFGREEGSGRRW